MAYEATAQLFQRQADLAKKRAQSEYELAIGDLATQFRQSNRDLEANLESRGILRSGEGMRGRVRLGAAEKAAQLAAETARQGALDQADLTHLQQLAELQAKGYTGGGDVTPTPGTPAPAPSAPKPSTPSTPSRPSTPTPPAEQARPPQPGNPPPGYKYVWNGTKWVLEAISTGGPVTPGMPATRPIEGGINEIGSGGRVIGSPPAPKQDLILGYPKEVWDAIDWNALKPQPLQPIKGNY